jgi:hypothetical protein
VSASESQINDLRIKLLPHQTALVDAVLNPTSKRIIQLRGDVGLGKSTALVALAGRLLHERPTARVLFIVPGGAFQRQIEERLRGADIPTLLVDRYRLMLDSTTDSEFWPIGVVAVLSQEFAKQPDILAKLTKTHWELVMVDQAHTLRGVRMEAFRSIEASADRVVLATTALRDPNRTDAFPVDDTTVVEWRRDQVVDHEGKPLDTAPLPILHEVPFGLTPTELSLGETVRHLGSLLGRSTESQKLVAKTIFRSLQSSPDAVDGVLRRLADRTAVISDVKQSLDYIDMEHPENQLNISIDPFLANEVVARVVKQALRQVDEISIDSKFNAFWELLSRLVQSGSKRICILTDYLATLFYLSAAIETGGMHSLLLHGEIVTAEDYEKTLMSFANGDGILVATRASLTAEVTLGTATDLVLYDIPSSGAALKEILALFDPFGRRSQLSVHVLLPAHSFGDPDSESLRLLHQMVGSKSGMH